MSNPGYRYPAPHHPDFASQPPLDLSALKTYDLESRPSKVFHDDLGRPVGPEASVGEWLMSLPRQLAGNDIRRVAEHLVRAQREGRTVACALGGHVIKTGCAPYLIDWIQQGLIQMVSMNGSASCLSPSNTSCSILMVGIGGYLFN